MGVVPEKVEGSTTVASGVALPLDQILNTVIGSHTENNIASVPASSDPMDVKKLAQQGTCSGDITTKNSDMIHIIQETRFLVNSAQISYRTVDQETLVNMSKLPRSLYAAHFAWNDMWEVLTSMSRNLTTLIEELWGLEDTLKNSARVTNEAKVYLSMSGNEDGFGNLGGNGELV
ncbi:hypothetical protein EAF04_009001 [Stromatinia cepivora]|nr:hypothetical protein EAF04_009001 [Stromatinia cepivora]